jgi:hypothetical protein
MTVASSTGAVRFGQVMPKHRVNILSLHANWQALAVCLCVLESKPFTGLDDTNIVLYIICFILYFTLLYSIYSMRTDTGELAWPPSTRRSMSPSSSTRV